MRFAQVAQTVSRKNAGLVTFVGAFVLSLLLSPSASPASAYDPRTSAIYEPRPQPRDGFQIQNSIIVPAYRERDNIRALVTRVLDTLPHNTARETEIIIVDDNSNDGSEEEVKSLQAEGRNVDILVRRSKAERGLSSAVLRGFERARGSKLLVMDADLQHPADFVGPLFDALSDKTPFAIGTRYGAGVSMSKDWPMYRRIISWGARILARPLTSASDPMSGFFAIKKDLFLRSKPINSSGFKIALELLLKAPLPSSGLAEVPYSFAARTQGSSKLGAKVMLRYVGQLIALYVWSLGFLWHVLVAASVTAGVAVARRVAAHVHRRAGGSDSILPLSSRRINLKKRTEE
ncbi:hypothetical protein RQP46_000358 [Phenoliferia psychrophenolica]